MRALLLDLKGVLFEDSTPYPGAVEVLAQAREMGLLLRFVTNTATRHHRDILDDLQRMGFQAEETELFTAPLAALSLLRRRQWRPYCLVHPAIAEIFPQDPLDRLTTPGEQADCVVLGDAREGFTYETLNRVFRLVMEGRPLIGIGRNRCFREDGQWMLDAGPFLLAIEWAARCEALVVGKPSAAFFDELVASTGLPAGDCLMVGDDVEADVAAAIDRGLAGCLVRTGKFQEAHLDLLPDGGMVIDSIDDLPSLLESKQK